MSDRKVKKAFKARTSMGVIYLAVPLVMLLPFALNHKLEIGASGLTAPAVLVICFMLIGLWYLFSRLVVFKEDKVSVKLSIIGMKNTVAYTDIKKIDESNPRLILIISPIKKVKIPRNYFTGDDYKAILSELKKRTGRR